MSEPQASEEVVKRPLTKDEINKLNRRHRTRLGKAFVRFPKIRQMITQSIWQESGATESIEIPKDAPEWKHIVSRPSTDELTIRSEYLVEPGINADNLYFHFPEANPGLAFTKIAQGKIVEDPSNNTDVPPAAEAFVSRIEQQLRPVQKAPNRA